MRIDSDYIYIFNFQVTYPSFNHLGPSQSVRNFMYITIGQRIDVRPPCHFDCYKMVVI